MFEKAQVLFWPVGTGDSSSIVIRDGIVLQVDLRHMESKSKDSDEHVSIIDILVSNLPKKGGKPYLSGFALTHPDLDHICGFEKLLEMVQIGEIWFTPRVFLEYKKDLCDDALKFREEAMRRVKKIIKNKGDVGSGDRIRIIGYDNLLEEGDFKGFPDELVTIPGNSISELDGEDYQTEFNAFIHAPFKGNLDKDRNDTSLAMQVVLGDKFENGGVLFFGDLSYSGLREIFDVSEYNDNLKYLKWKVLLAPHHCSKSAMYQVEDGKEKFKKDIMEDIENVQAGNGYIVASCEKIPSKNEEGDNPPHAKAKQKYEEVAIKGFLCTHENGKIGEALTFNLVDGEFSLVETNSDSSDVSDSVDLVTPGIASIRESNAPPTRKTGFGDYESK